MSTDKQRNQSPGGNYQNQHRPHQQPPHTLSESRQYSPLSGGQSLAWVVGLRVKVTTTLDDEITGSVYTYCTLSNTLAITEDETPNAQKPDLKNFRIVKTSFIKDIAVLGRKEEDKEVADQLAQSNGKSGGPFAKVQPLIGPVQIGGVVQKMNSAARAAGQTLAQKGVGVTREAQDLFDSLAKTYVYCVCAAQKICLT